MKSAIPRQKPSELYLKGLQVYHQLSIEVSITGKR